MVASPQHNITTLFSTICSNYYRKLHKKKQLGSNYPAQKKQKKKRSSRKKISNDHVAPQVGQRYQTMIEICIMSGLEINISLSLSLWPAPLRRPESSSKLQSCSSSKVMIMQQTLGFQPTVNLRDRTVRAAMVLHNQGASHCKEKVDQENLAKVSNTILKIFRHLVESTQKSDKNIFVLAKAGAVSFHV